MVKVGMVQSTMRWGNVLLADSHSPMLEGIRSLLDERFQAVVMVADERSLLESMERLRPDVAIVDVSLPRTTGGNIITLLHNRFPGVNVIALSAFDDPTLANRILASGAAAVVLKSSAVIDLDHALDAVAHGRQYVSPNIRPQSVPHP